MNRDAPQDDRLIAALCHASVLASIFGLFVPLSVWLSQRERSPLLRFQALQALVYNLAGLFVLFLFYACWIGNIFSIFPLSLLGTLISNLSDSNGSGVLILLFMLLPFGVAFLMMGAAWIGGPLYIIYSLYGAVRVLNGHNFHYLLVGRWVARRLELTAPVQKEASQ